MLLGRNAMPSTPKPPELSPQQRFSTRARAAPEPLVYPSGVIADGLPCWPTGEPSDSAALERLCSDDRIQNVWRLTGDMSDDAFWYFMSELHIAWKAGRLFLGHRE